MNQTSPTNDLRTTRLEDNLDRALSDFFKSKMKQPWPAAPATPARIPTSEPSGLVAARTAAGNATVEAPRNQPATAGTPRDASSKSRYTLAVSVVVLLGSCWFLSNGFQPGEQTGPVNSSPKFFGVLPDAGAENPAALKELRKDKAEQGNEGFASPKIKLP
jgi:hypothetical protein